MNVQLDPNWDNTALIIDCSASRKRRQEELEKYTAYAVEMKAKEENSGEIQSPPPGTVEYNPTTSGCVVSIVLHIEMNRSQSGVAKKRPTVLCKLKHPKLGGTVVPVKNYSKHYSWCPMALSLSWKKQGFGTISTERIMIRHNTCLVSSLFYSHQSDVFILLTTFFKRI
jgi:hypothetical protein